MTFPGHIGVLLSPFVHADGRQFRCLLGPLFFLCFSSYAFTQSDSTDIYNLSFSQLSQLKIISASKVSQPIAEVSSTVFVLSAMDIKQRGYLTLDDVLGDLPGFQFRNIQSINSYIFQRGLPNQNNLTLILIDGVQVNELNSGGFYAGGQYNLANVERIEVIHGPASVAYGTNAISGIVNIITRSAENNYLEAYTQAGTFNTLNSGFVMGYKHDEKPISVNVSAMVKTTDRSDLRGDAGDNNWTDLMDNFDRNYAVDMTWRYGKFVLGTNYQHKHSSGAAYVRSVGTNYRDYGTLWNLRFINNYLKYSSRLSDKLNYSSMLYNRNSTVLPNSVLYIVDTAQIAYYRPNHLVGTEHILDYVMNSFFSVAGGLVFEYEKLASAFSLAYSDAADNKPAAPSKPDMLNNTLASMYIEPRINPLKNLFVSGGVRFDNSSIYDQVFTPRAGISYQLSGMLARFSYAEAFRAPKPWDYYDGLGNPSLLPERMKSLEAALNLLLNESLKAEIAAYSNQLDNAITRHNFPDGHQWVNRGSVSIHGFELVLRHISPRLNAYANYTYNDSRDEMDAMVPEISTHSGNLGFTYTSGSHWHMHLRANYASQRKNPKMITSTSSEFVDPYLVFNAAIGYEDFHGFDFELAVRNLLNSAYYHTSNRDPDRYRQPQRTLLLSIGYKMSY